MEKYRASFYLPITHAQQRINSSEIIDDGGDIEIVVSSESDRLQLLKPFNDWNKKDPLIQLITFF